MAPEILNYHKYNIKSDLWSVGVILYEMVMNEHPFKALNITELTNIINRKKPLLLNVDIHPECKNLIERLLIVDSNNRLEWNELYENNWIYNNNIIREISEKEKLHNEIKTLAKNEYNFDYCFENSITDINLFENNNDLDDELNHKSNIKNINLKDIIIHNYIRI
jgi:serine/threonine protein kinase